MTRAAIYARYSTELQDERSITDQIALCSSYAAREGLQVVKTYSDAARSGASIHLRDGLKSLIKEAEAGAFDVVIVEALDRLARSMADLAGLADRLKFRRISIHTPNRGIVTATEIFVGAFMAEEFRRENARKVRRGLAGRVREGLWAGGRPFGYRADPNQKGKLLVDEAEAIVVRRIFSEFSAGRSPRQIAHDLNRDGIPAPRGRAWNASTINGSVERGNGIIRNGLYAGRVVWNKVTMDKNPDTGKRVSRPNPKSEWQVVEVPHLAIVPPDIFAAAQERKRQGTGERPETFRRPRRLLSGLLRCGCCGSGMSVSGKDRSGRVRIRCSAATESGTCSDPKTFYLDTVERLVTRTMVDLLRRPEATEEFLHAYLDERRRIAAKAIVRRSSLERRRDECQRGISNLVGAVETGAMKAEDIGSRVADLRTEREAIEAELALEPEPLNVVDLHPAALKHYSHQLMTLRQALNDGHVGGDSAGAEALRDLISTVSVHRDDNMSSGIRIVLEGRLNALLGTKAPPRHSVWGTVVAEEGLEPPTQGL